MTARFELALGGDAPAGRWLVIGAGADAALDPLDPAQTLILQGFAPDHQALQRRGWTVATDTADRFDGAVVVIPRARDLARARIHQAHALVDGPLWIDGQKTDGIDAVLRELRSLGQVQEVHSKAHGKIFRVALDAVPAEWAARDLTPAPGFRTRAGMFSADAPDPGSVMLAGLLPDKMPTRVVDLGAGWGWLAAQVLARPGVETLHLVEADYDALTAAQANITDPRAQFHWADARLFRLPEPVNGVVMNPPFHQGRDADPRLGAAFIVAASGLLTGAGRLWMVANRHLPYEHVLSEHFASFDEIGGDNRFKVLTATGAKRGRARR